ncbi:hypothetical protein BX600DRAFT_385283 [Xylariales sp. PMI_506]|nr:hypothetical protein BX600DRAFT_385283 [Xylariales sp. PMI_506]
MLRCFSPALVFTFAACWILQVAGCLTDDDCNLNGVCSRDQTCLCDPGWRADDCGELDLQPVERYTGYNHTNATGTDFYKQGAGNSSWCGQIIQDPKDETLFHLIISQFSHGCGLSAWRPFSTIARAESRTGPRGPYNFAEALFGPFHHNPTVKWSPADEQYLLYFIGKDVDLPNGTCSSTKFNNNVSVSTSPDLRTWSVPEVLLQNQTNPAPFALWTQENRTSDLLLAVEGNDIYESTSGPDGPYDLIVNQTALNDAYATEDPFLWRDKRGHWHILAHYLIDIPLGLKGPRVGGHLYARDLAGPWTFNNRTLAYNTTVSFTDGSETTYYRRERPKLFLSPGPDRTPLYLVNAVQEFNATGGASYTLIQPVGQKWKDYEKGLGF